MREVATEHQALFNKFFNREKINPLSVHDLQIIASHYTKREFADEYDKYLKHTFKGSLMNHACMDMALINNRSVFLPENYDDTRIKNKKQSKKTV